MRLAASLRQLGIALAALLSFSACLQAQDFPVFRENLTVATLNSARLFAQSQVGRNALEQSRTKTLALADENRDIEAELEQEELRLTELRKTVSAEEFRSLAEAFDKKVVATRKTQAAKAAALTQELTETQRAFSTQVRPILSELMAEMGIIFILNEQAIVLADRSGDITNEALRRVDMQIGATLAPGK